MIDDDEIDESDYPRPTDDAHRFGGVRPVSTVIGDIEWPKEMAAMTAADWAKRDAAIDVQKAELAEKAELEAREAAALEMRTELGWPAHKLRDAIHSDVSLSAPRQLLAHDFARRHIVILAGTNGCGKTVAAARWAIERAPRARFVRAATFAAGSRYDKEARKLWFAARALVLDDLGAEYLDEKGSFRVDLDELFDTFYSDERRLVITTNIKDPPAFKERYGPRIYDRMIEAGSWLSVGGASMRRPA